MAVTLTDAAVSGVRRAVGAPADAPVPLVAVAAATMRGIDQVGADASLGLQATGIRHAEQRIRGHRPLREGAELEVATVLEAVVPYGRGNALLLGHRVQDTDGPVAALVTVLAAEVDLELTADGPPPAGSRSRGGDEITSEVVADAAAVAAWCAAVGDDNPLHHDGSAARAAGLDGPIVPGWLTLGLALEAARRAGLLPPEASPVEVASRFSRPVPVGADLALSVAPGRPDGVVLAARSAAGPALRGAWAAPAGPPGGQ